MGLSLGYIIIAFLIVFSVCVFMLLFFLSIRNTHSFVTVKGTIIEKNCRLELNNTVKTQRPWYNQIVDMFGLPIDFSDFSWKRNYPWRKLKSVHGLCDYTVEYEIQNSQSERMKLRTIAENRPDYRYFYEGRPVKIDVNIIDNNIGTPHL